MDEKTASPSLGFSLLPLAFLVALLVANVSLFGDDATSGANQLALLFAAGFAAVLGLTVLKQDYRHIEKRAIHSIMLAMEANLILLSVGMLIGLWILGGIVPAMIYYGIQLVNPRVFLVVACLTCSIVSVAVGSSWSTMGTVGIALLGIGKTLGIPVPLVAGAIISGAYFGDKMSPLSDTTNLAPAVAGTELFTHIRHMLYTTIPAYVLAVALYTGIGLLYSPASYDPALVEEVLAAIRGQFNLGPHLFVAPVVVIILAVRRTPALPALVIGALLGALTALLFQPGQLLNAEGVLTPGSAYARIVTVAHSGYAVDSGNELIDALFSNGGLLNMLNTVLLIIMAMLFGGVMEATHMLPKIAESILGAVRGAGSLVGATIATCLLFNTTASDQYLGIVIPGRMFRHAYREQRLKPRNLSRALEDGATVTSVLVPWNTCGAYTSTVLATPTLSYLPFAFFNWASPIISAFMAGLGIGIVYYSDEEWTAVEAEEAMLANVPGH